EIKYLGAFRNMELQAGVQWNYFGYSNEVYDTNYNPLELEAGSFFNYFARIFINSYANLYYPQKGWLGKMEAKLITNNFISYGEYTPIGTLSFDLETALSITNRFTILPRIAGRRIWGDKIPPIYLNCMGGDLSGRYLPQQIAFPGICNIQLFDNTLLMGQLAFRYRIAKKHYTYLIGGYAKNGDTLGSLLDNKNIWAGTAKYSYDSAIGPISIAINYSNWVKEVGVYINLGYYF
ncbi:MAG: patatin, partial [Bacteroidales bacterium]